MSISFEVSPSNGDMARELANNPEELVYILNEIAEAIDAGDTAELIGWLEDQATPATAKLLHAMAEAAA